MTANAAVRSSDETALDAAVNGSNEIFARLHRVVFGHRSLSFVRDWKYVPVRERRRLLREVDDLHREGAPWPRMPFGRGGASEPWKPRVAHDELLPRTQRPDNLPYCVTWSGAYWRPCCTAKERQQAGYVGLMMCWPPPIPQCGTFIVSGERARFAYRVVEVARFSRPRTAKRYTCRLWCVRLDPRDIPHAATVHRFYWHPRKRRT